MGQTAALRLLRASLAKGGADGYELAAELLRFLSRSGHDFTSASPRSQAASGEGKEGRGGGGGALGRLFSAMVSSPSRASSSASKNGGDSSLSSTMLLLLREHAAELLSSRKLRELAWLLRASQLDLGALLAPSQHLSARAAGGPAAADAAAVAVLGPDFGALLAAAQADFSSRHDLDGSSAGVVGEEDVSCDLNVAEGEVRAHLWI